MRTPILTYHKLVKQTKDKIQDCYTLAEADFLSHLEFLHSNGYKPVLVEDYCRAIVDPSIRLPEKSVLITFDDGHVSNFTTALPLLERFDFKATFFITTDNIGAPNYLEPGQIRELRKRGMSVQSHAKTHLFLNDLNESEIWNELNGSKKLLEDILGTEVPFLSFPGGRYNNAVLQGAKKAQYQACFSSKPFYFKRLGNLLLIGRCTMRYISDKTPFEEILNLNVFGRSALITAHYCKDLLKVVLGNDMYYALWKRYVSR